MNKTEILTHLSEEEIFSKYIGPVKTGKMIRSPLRKENTPSFHVFKNKSGNLMFKDFGSGEHGDCFKFIMLMFRVDFSGAIRIIEEDFKLVNKSQFIPRKNRIDFYSLIPKKEESVKTEFEFTEKNFTTDELDYWKQFGITPNILQEYNTVSIASVKETRWRNPVISTPNCPVFAYKYPSGNIRFYRPLAFDKRFFGNTNGNDIFGYEQAFRESYENKEQLSKLVICAGQKDTMCLFSNTSIRAIALNSESAILTKELFQKLKKVSDNIAVCYDMDKTGRTQAEKLCSEYNLEDIMKDFKVQGKEKDVSDYFQRINKEELVTV